MLNGIDDYKYVDIDTPEPKDNEVLVNVKACGICGSDIPRAYRDGAHNMPLIIGHEFAGKVVEAGNSVPKEWMNKKVGIFPLIPCKECVACKQKKYEMCRDYSYLGSRTNGGFAEYVSVPEWNLIELPDSISYEEAAMLEPMAVAVHAMRRAGLKQDDTVVVIGLGTIGMLLTMFLMEAGVKNILTVGNKEYQKHKVLTLGIPEANYCDTKREDVSEWIKSKTDNKGANVVFECVGRCETYEQAVDIAAISGTVMLVGNPNSDMELSKNIYWKILRNQLTVLGTWNSSFTHDEDDDWHYVLNRLADGRVNSKQFISHSFSLENIVDGFEIMRDKKEDYLKIIANI